MQPEWCLCKKEAVADPDTEKRHRVKADQRLALRRHKLSDIRSFQKPEQARKGPPRRLQGARPCCQRPGPWTSGLLRWETTQFSWFKTPRLRSSVTAARETNTWLGSLCSAPREEPQGRAAMLANTNQHRLKNKAKYSVSLDTK